MCFICLYLSALDFKRILSPCLPNGVEMIDKAKAFADAYPAAYQTLYQAKPITCSVTDTTFDAVPAPCSAILDVSVRSTVANSSTIILPFLFYFQFFSLPQLQATRAISGYSVPIIACVSSGVGTMLRLFGPESMGGVGDFGARIDAEIARTGLSDLEIGLKVYISKSYLYPD